MRIDQFLSQSLNISRSDAKRLLRRGEILINDTPCSNSGAKVDANDAVNHGGQLLSWPGDVYWLLNKPSGFCCSHIDDGAPSALQLLPKNKKKLHFAGRLDTDTTGLLLISSDGQWCHSVTSPKQKKLKHKVYHVTLARPLDEAAAQILRDGILLNGELNKTLPAQLVQLDEFHCELSISEGRYHQVKRMFAAVGNHVCALHRQQVGRIILETPLKSGSYRALTTAEIESMQQ